MAWRIFSAGMVSSLTYPTPRLMSTPSRKSDAKSAIIRFTGDGTLDARPYSDKTISPMLPPSTRGSPGRSVPDGAAA